MLAPRSARCAVRLACVLIALLAAACQAPAAPQAALSPLSPLSPIETPPPSREVHPLSQIAGLGYVGDPAGGDTEIVTVRGDGSGLVRLTDNPRSDRGPRWSASGAFILWQQVDPGYMPEQWTGDTWLMAVDGARARRLGSLPGEEMPFWSPVHDDILIYAPTYPPFQEERPSHDALYLARAAADGLTPVVEEGWLRNPQWSPDGEAISFVLERSTRPAGLYTAGRDGTDLRLVGPGAVWSNEDTWDAKPFWSPDGAWLTYGTWVGKQGDVYIVRPDGSETRTLVASPVHETAVAWVEGGQRLAVQRLLDPAGFSDAFDLVSVTGETTPWVASEPDHRRTFAALSPDGARMAYWDAFGPDAGRQAQLRVQATDSLTSTVVSPALRGAPVMDLRFAGWSSDGRQIAYIEQLYDPPVRRLWVSDVDAVPPTHRLLSETPWHSGPELPLAPTWLPSEAADWLSVSTGPGALLYNTRTDEQITIPGVIVETWRTIPPN